MPVKLVPNVERIWKHEGEDKIHFILDGRRLYAVKGTALYEILEKYLRG